MKTKINLILTTVLFGLCLFQSAGAASFVGPLVRCGTRTPSTAPCEIGNLVTGVYIIINFLVGSVTILAIAYIVYAGVRMIVGAGNQTEVQKAKDTMRNAVVGLIMVILSYVIIGSVIYYFTGYSFDDLRLFFKG